MEKKNGTSTPPVKSSKRVRIELSAPRRIGGQMRKPQYALLEGVCLENVTVNDVSKALAAGEAHAVAIED